MQQGAWARVATMSYGDAGVSVSLVDSDAAAIAECVYAWMTPAGAWVRIGTSQSPVGGRLRQYARHFNATLAGAKSPAPVDEVARWLSLLQEHGHLVAHVHQPDPIETVAGFVRPFLDIERVLIRTHKAGLLNRSHR